MARLFVYSHPFASNETKWYNIENESDFARARNRHAQKQTVSVIIPIKDYEELLERLEDKKDVAWLKRARRKPTQFMPIEEYLTTRAAAFH